MFQTIFILTIKWLLFISKIIIIIISKIKRYIYIHKKMRKFIQALNDKNRPISSRSNSQFNFSKDKSADGLLIY